MLPYKTVDEYIAETSPEIQEILKKIRTITKGCSPDVGERISYGMPTYTLNGVLFYFAACKNHLGFYPTPDGIEAFKQKLSEYKTSKGAIQFPYRKPIPYELIREIIQYRISQDTKQ